MMTIEIIEEAGAWGALMQALCEQAEAEVFNHLGLDPVEFETTILLTDDAHIKILNHEFRSIDKPTDVLSFPSFEFTREPGTMPKLPESSNGPFTATLGDIALGYETCLSDAGSKRFDDHLTHLIIHGFLHLLGYDHEDDADAELMQRLEVEILEKMHIINPYIET